MPDSNPPLARTQVAARAQSEVVGVALLVGVFALLAILVGTVIIGNVTDQADDEPLVDLNATANTENVTLVHAGGDDLLDSEVDVIVRQGSDERRFDLDSFDETSGNGDNRFTPGEKRRHSHPFSSGTVRVFVVHEPSNAVVLDATVDAR
jgi:FlaG/FlaF family flagellin (archaellin)